MSDTPAVADPADTPAGDVSDVTPEDIERIAKPAMTAAEMAAASAPVEEAVTDSIPEAPGAPQSEDGNRHGEVAALQERLQALEAQLAAKEAEQKAAAEALEKGNLLAAAGLDGKYAKFLSGDNTTWQEQVNDLVALRGAAPARRDPALDADMGADSEAMENVVLRFFGMGD